MNFKKIKNTKKNDSFKRTITGYLCLLLLIGIASSAKSIEEEKIPKSVSKEPPVEKFSNTDKVPPYGKFESALKKAKLQGPKSSVITKIVKKDNGTEDEVKVEGENFKDYKSEEFYMIDNQMYFKSPKEAKRRTELRRGEPKTDAEPSENLTSKGSLTVHTVSHQEFTVMQLHHSGKNSPLLKIEYKSKKNDKGKYVTGGFYAVNREKPGASTSGRTKLLKEGSSATFEIKYRPYEKTLENGKKQARAEIKVKVDNSTTVDIADILQSDWEKGFYLKAGAYNQKSGSAKVSFSSLSW